MLALYIIFGIIFFILLLLVFPVFIKINTSQKNKSYVRYLFLKFKLDKPNKPNKKDEHKEEQPKTSENKKENKKNNISTAKKIFKKFTLKEFISLLKLAIKEISPPVKFILKHIKIYNLNLYLGICGEDTFDAANKTGLVSSFSFGLFYFICDHIKNLKSYSLKIEPLFLSEENKINLNSKIRVFPIFVVFPSLKILIKVIKFRKIILR